MSIRQVGLARDDARERLKTLISASEMRLCWWSGGDDGIDGRVLKPWETHITNRSHSQEFLITVHEKKTHSQKHTYEKLLNQSR